MAEQQACVDIYNVFSSESVLILDAADPSGAGLQGSVAVDASLPAAEDHRHAIFRAVAQLETEERARFFYAFLALANRIAVADRLDLGDSETLPGTLEKAATVTSRGLEFVASENGVAMVEALRRSGVERLFRVGVNLAPDGIRPPYSDSEGDEENPDRGD